VGAFLLLGLLVSFERLDGALGECQRAYSSVRMPVKIDSTKYACSRSFSAALRTACACGTVSERLGQPGDRPGGGATRLATLRLTQPCDCAYVIARTSDALVSRTVRVVLVAAITARPSRT
jgi:hypothetical protein